MSFINHKPAASAPDSTDHNKQFLARVRDSGLPFRHRWEERIWAEHVEVDAQVRIRYITSGELPTYLPHLRCFAKHLGVRSDTGGYHRRTKNDIIFDITAKLKGLHEKAAAAKKQQEEEAAAAAAAAKKQQEEEAAAAAAAAKKQQEEDAAAAAAAAAKKKAEDDAWIKSFFSRRPHVMTLVIWCFGLLYRLGDPPFSAESSSTPGAGPQQQSFPSPVPRCAGPPRGDESATDASVDGAAGHSAADVKETLARGCVEENPGPAGHLSPAAGLDLLRELGNIATAHGLQSSVNHAQSTALASDTSLYSDFSAHVLDVLLLDFPFRSIELAAKFLSIQEQGRNDNTAQLVQPNDLQYRNFKAEVNAEANIQRTLFDDDTNTVLANARVAARLYNLGNGEDVFKMRLNTVTCPRTGHRLWWSYHYGGRVGFHASASTGTNSTERANMRTHLHGQQGQTPLFDQKNAHGVLLRRGLYTQRRAICTCQGTGACRNRNGRLKGGLKQPFKCAHVFYAFDPQNNNNHPLHLIFTCNDCNLHTNTPHIGFFVHQAQANTGLAQRLNAVWGPMRPGPRVVAANDVEIAFTAERQKHAVRAQNEATRFVARYKAFLGAKTAHDTVQLFVTELPVGVLDA